MPLEKEIARRGLKTRILGTTPDSIDLAEDRERFNALMNLLNIPSPMQASPTLRRRPSGCREDWLSGSRQT